MRKHTKSLVPKKLNLDTETVRGLDRDALGGVAGANSGKANCGSMFCSMVKACP